MMKSDAVNNNSDQKSKFFSFMPEMDQIPAVKVLFNVGGLLDIPTGRYVKGKYGEQILNGGLGAITGVVGIGNNFKSTVMHFMMLSAGSKFPYTNFSTYDTEINIQEYRLTQISQSIEQFKDRDIIHEGVWTVTDKTKYFANEWYEKKKENYAAKIKNAEKITVNTPFIDRDGKSLMTMVYPTFDEIDSFTEFETEDAAKMQDENELGDSGANTLYMRQGNSKTRFLTDVPKHIASSNSPLLMTAHIGKEIAMDARAAPVKKLQFLKNGDKIKGATDKFLFLTTVCWQCQNAAPLFNDSTKGPEYPRDSEDNMKFDTDLNTVTVTLLRNKQGPSGLTLQLIVSQQEGVLPALTEFHYIKTNERYGLAGTLQNYALDLLPEVKLSRTAVRSKIDNDAKLRRALNITAEMCQMKHLWHYLDEGLLCTPKQLYDDLISMGYDWSILLNTRGWWTCDNDKQDVPFLSTMDLLNMRKGTYHPYWLAEDKKTILKIK